SPPSAALASPPPGWHAARARVHAAASATRRRRRPTGGKEREAAAEGAVMGVCPTGNEGVGVCCSKVHHPSSGAIAEGHGDSRHPPLSGCHAHALPRAALAVTRKLYCCDCFLLADTD